MKTTNNNNGRITKKVQGEIAKRLNAECRTLSAALNNFVQLESLKDSDVKAVMHRAGISGAGKALKASILAVINSTAPKSNSGVFVKKSTKKQVEKGAPEYVERTTFTARFIWDTICDAARANE